MELTLAEALQRGISAHRSGNIKEADRFYTAVLKAQPDHPDANHNMGVIAVSLNKANKALPFFKKALDIKPSVAQYWLSYIDTLIKLKRFEKAEQILGQATQKGVALEKLDAFRAKLDPEVKKESPENLTPPQQQLNKLLAQFKSGRFGDAEELALSIIKKFPKHPLAWKVTGILVGQSGRSLDALSFSKMSVQLEPNDAEGHNNLGVHLHALDKLEEARGAFISALAITPNYAEALNNLGNTLKKLDNPGEAQTSYIRATKVQFDYAEAFNNLGKIFKEIGQLQDAELNLRKVASLKPTHPVAHNNLGVILQELEKLEEARASYELALKLKNDYAEAHNNLGTTLSKMKLLEKSVSSFLRALEIEPNYPVALYNLGNLLLELDKFSEATVCYKHAIIAQPIYPEVYDNLGTTYRKLNLSEKADKSHRQAILIRPEQATAYNNRAILLQEKGELGQAKEHYNQAIINNVYSHEAFNNLGYVLHEAGQLDDALECFRKSLKLNASFIEARYNLGVLAFEMHDYTFAAEQFSLVDFKNSKSYLLRCSYLEDDKAEFYRKLDDLIDQGEVNAVIGSLVNCAEARYGTKRFNPFCNEPLRYVMEINLNDKYDFEKIFVATAKKILDDKFTGYKDQSHLTNGVQTAGNLFRIGKSLCTEIENILRAELEEYRLHFIDSGEGFIQYWPKSYEIHGWLVSMTTGGELTAHMHDPGWITGSIYINVPPRSNADSGNIVLCEDDGKDVARKSQSRRKSIDVVTGSLCLFPASLHHYTIPFENEENRIVLAFDILPKN